MRDSNFEKLVEEFLAKRRIAIWGVENTDKASGQWVADRFRKTGIEVIAVNPEFDDDPTCAKASSLSNIDPPVEAALLYADRSETDEAVADCLKARVPLVWLHDALSPGAATPGAIEKLTAAGVRVIPGLCPMLYLKPVDPGHFCIRWFLKISGKERRVRQGASIAGTSRRASA